MRVMIVRIACLAAVLALFAVSFGHAQVQTPTVKKAPIPATSANSGSEMFEAYCAPCHGKDGKGNGPAAAALKVPPANLAQLASKNNGKFPADRVANVLRNGVSGGAHGSTDMPIWGPLFSQVSGRDEAVVQMRIANLIKYIESLQQK